MKREKKKHKDKDKDKDKDREKDPEKLEKERKIKVERKKESKDMTTGKPREGKSQLSFKLGEKQIKVKCCLILNSHIF